MKNNFDLSVFFSKKHSSCQSVLWLNIKLSVKNILIQENLIRSNKNIYIYIIRMSFSINSDTRHAVVPSRA